MLSNPVLINIPKHSLTLFIWPYCKKDKPSCHTKSLYLQKMTIGCNKATLSPLRSKFCSSDHKSMYGTKVGLAQDGRNLIPFLPLPKVNHVPTLRPREFEEFGWNAGISYDSLL